MKASTKFLEPTCPRSMLAIAFCVSLFGSASRALPSPSIQITSVPAYGTATDPLRGTVAGVGDYTQYRVAVFIYVPGAGWYTKPFITTPSTLPTVLINSDGTWSANVNTGGLGSLDAHASIHAAWLVPASFNPSQLSGAVRMPVELDPYPHDIKERYGPAVQFANRTWAVKDSLAPNNTPVLVSPGDAAKTGAPERRNFYSALPSDVWADAAGLHLSIHQHNDGKWWATEVTLLDSALGYGTYWYHTNSRTDILDVNVTFGGGYIYDDYGDEDSPDGSRTREIDIAEDSRWGVATDPATQNVKQPYDYVPANGANRHRFNLPNLSGDPALTRIMIWAPNSIHFITLKGHYSPTDYPPSAVVDDYIYTHDPTAGRYVPTPGRARFHFNLWLNKIANTTAPSDGQPVEVLISDFSFTPRTALANISTRLAVGTAENVLIGGFIVTGNSTKKIAIRGLGPSLSVNGVALPGRMSDPLIELHKPDGSVVTNDNWRDAPNVADFPSGLLPSEDRESMIVTTLSPGGYTVIVKGAHGETGVGLVEAYDLEEASPAQLANISSRGFVQTANNVMIGGIIITGPSDTMKKVAIRGLGPSLSVNGVAVPGRMSDPLIELHKPDGSVVTNDNWKDASNVEDFPSGLLPSEDRESMIVTTLSPGGYTVIVRGAHGETGVGLVEAYQLGN